MLKTQSSMWYGTLGVIHATEHAIVTPPDALPIRAQFYRTGPLKRHIIEMLNLNVIAPGHSAWASPVVIVPKKHERHSPIMFPLSSAEQNHQEGCFSFASNGGLPGPLGRCPSVQVPRLHRGVLAGALV